MSPVSLLATMLPISTLLLASVQPEQTRIGALSGDSGRGKTLYRRFCVGCHGKDGDGLGENAAYLDPRPRDFTACTFKCRSTPTGSLPLDSDLFATLSRGIHASAMPSWIALMPQQRADLVAYIKTFCSRFQSEKAKALPIPPETADNPESQTSGKKVYDRMECWKCHGREGKGNGPSASTLTDSKDRPIVPYDFTSGERFKCGKTNEDLYRIFMTGLDGTPMPAYNGDLNSNDAWDLVHYLRTMQVHAR